MSRRAHYRRAAREQARDHGDESVAMVVGWCLTETELPEARRGTHDAVIKLLGRQRRGGVSWRQLTGDNATAVLAALHAGLDPGDEVMHSHYRHLGALLREHGGWLVIASAPGDRSVAP